MDTTKARHGSFDGGWNRHPGPEPDWEEVSIALQIAYRSLIDIAVRGMPGDTAIKLLLDDHLLVEAKGAAVARTWTDRGSRRLALQWRGRDLPNPDVMLSTRQLRTVAELEKEHPELLKIVMKHQNPKRFVLCPIFVISFPKGPDVPVYGIFTVDKSELAQRPAGDKVVKQDFLVYESVDRSVAYYSGQGMQGDDLHGTIDDFCARFGEPHFGCIRVSTTKWDCKDHHYAMDDDRLPVEPSFRDVVADAIRRAKGEIENSQATPSPRTANSRALVRVAAGYRADSKDGSRVGRAGVFAVSLHRSGRAKIIRKHPPT